MSDFIDAFHEAAHNMADELELDGEDRDEFIDGVMERKGYRRVTSWALPEDDEGQGGKKPLIPPRKKPRAGAQGGQQQRRSPYFGGKS